MSEEREEINPKTFYMINNADIEEIEIRKIGLLEVFGKIEIDITYKDNTVKKLYAISPVKTKPIIEWLEANSLYKKTKMYDF